MLVLSRKLGEKIYIGDNICITVVDIDRGKIRLGIEAPREVAIYRLPKVDDLRGSLTFGETGRHVPFDVKRYFMVYDVASESPLELAPALSKRLKNRLLLKREDLQPVFSFKLRGAYNKMAQLPAAKLKRGVIAASAGNHAQAVAYHAGRLGVSATIVMPETTPIMKVANTRGHGARVVLFGTSYDEAYLDWIFWWYLGTVELTNRTIGRQVSQSARA